MKKDYMEEIQRINLKLVPMGSRVSKSRSPKIFFIKIEILEPVTNLLNSV